MNELIEWLTTSNASAETVRSLLDDQGTDMAALHAAASERLTEMRTNVDTDATVTAEKVRAVQTIIAASAPPADETTEPDTDAEEDTGTENEPDTDAAVDTATEADDTDSPSEDTTDDGGGAVTLDKNQDPDTTASAPASASVEGEVITAEAFKNGGTNKVQMTMNQPGVAARFSDAKAANDQYQVFAGGTGVELFTAGDVSKHVDQQYDLLRAARGSNDPRGVSLVQYQAREGAFKFHRAADMSNRQVIELLDHAVAHHGRQNFAEAVPTWCAPSLQHYEFCPVPTSWGRFSDALPMIVSDRGSNSWPITPSLTEIWGLGVECRTAEEEAQRAEEGTPKGCAHLGCTDWETHIDRICHICVTSDVLGTKAFPELTDQLLRTYQLMYELWVDWQMLQLAIEIADEQHGELRWDTAGYGITAALKEKIGFAIDSAAAKYNLDPWSTQWNLAVPFWIYSMIQADLQKRAGNDLSMMQVTREPIDLILKGGRNVRIWPQQLWQQAATEDVPDPAMKTWMGSDTSIENGVYPETVEMLLWPQGALLGVRDDFIDIRARWDYGLQRQNQQLEMFTETQWNVIPRCFGVFHITLDICTAGRSGNLFDYPCGTAAVEAPAEEPAGV